MDFVKEFNKKVDNISKNHWLWLYLIAIPLPRLKMSRLKFEWQQELVINLVSCQLVTKQTERVTMGELLASKDTKKLITTYFMKTLEEHLKSPFVIAGNSITRVSIGPVVTEKKNNHVEGDTLIIAAIEEASDSLIESHFLVCSTGMDVFFLLTNHCNRFQCKNIYQQLVSGFIKINQIGHVLGVLCNTTILILHGVTGCDTVGRFSGKTKVLQTTKPTVSSSSCGFW